DIKGQPLTAKDWGVVNLFEQGQVDPYDLITYLGGRRKKATLPGFGRRPAAPAVSPLAPSRFLPELGGAAARTTALATTSLLPEKVLQQVGRVPYAGKPAEAGIAGLTSPIGIATLPLFFAAPEAGLAAGTWSGVARGLSPAAIRAGVEVGAPALGKATLPYALESLRLPAEMLAGQVAAGTAAEALGAPGPVKAVAELGGALAGPTALRAGVGLLGAARTKAGKAFLDWTEEAFPREVQGILAGAPGAEGRQIPRTAAEIEAQLGTLQGSRKATLANVKKMLSPEAYDDYVQKFDSRVAELQTELNAARGAAFAEGRAAAPAPAAEEAEPSLAEVLQREKGMVLTNDLPARTEIDT
ncbi:MAG: hypothetical protein LUO93_00140, partial [Methanomicrobiales archaeon]|nr:hypothetical protein [Methanomicrobiales archaeon]